MTTGENMTERELIFATVLPDGSGTFDEGEADQNTESDEVDDDVVDDPDDLITEEVE